MAYTTWHPPVAYNPPSRAVARGRAPGQKKVYGYGALSGPPTQKDARNYCENQARLRANAGWIKQEDRGAFAESCMRSIFTDKQGAVTVTPSQGPQVAVKPQGQIATTGDVIANDVANGSAVGAPSPALLSSLPSWAPYAAAGLAVVFLMRR